ncbi:MAG: Gfo/Idh/MocA family oxidoreductase [Erysipelotrichaceae bacterium]|nr:Gfo/Idh/MocA family oxidoreductase [Erysipelotrichaceae bacterium]
MKLGIVGAGMIVKDLMRFINDVPDFDIQAIATRKESYEKNMQFASEYHIPKVYHDIDELLADDNIDVVYIATNNYLHYQMCLKALNMGKHVICEKPFTSNVEELKILNEVAIKNHVILLEAISTQYLPNVLKMKEVIDNIGNIKKVSANYSQYSSRYNAFKEGKIMPAFDVNQSGGALMDLNVYNIHLIVALFGKPLAVHYQANIEKGIDTSGILTLDYGDFKAVCIGAKDCKAPIMTSIQGDQGCILVQTPANTVKDFKVIKNDNSEQIYNVQTYAHRMYYEFIEFVKILQNLDYHKANEMMSKSMIVMDIITQARKSVGIVFPADKEVI